ncbi:integral membrane protein 2C isoform X3 [Erinaceus europaeus]|uniref:Integral membrane protein 2 n=1 Tax=Erinaceus europaeus TaxID=9365 RepID=A0ABM3XLP3_ERIEU|nr:integral membrane protein 2C isoform X3 [Erinaceus europaeus]
MVKISFQPAAAGVKADKADRTEAAAPAAGPATEILLTPARLARDNFFHCGMFYEDSLSSQARTRMELEEDVKIYLEENYERINVPVPQFGGGDPADIIHDFQRGLTAYHDISLDKCYVIELNTTIVLPPRNFWELLMNVKGSRSEKPRTAAPSATLRTSLWWRRSSVGWCEGPPSPGPTPAPPFLPAILWPLPLALLVLGPLPIDVTSSLSLGPAHLPVPEL